MDIQGHHCLEVHVYHDVDHEHAPYYNNEQPKQEAEALMGPNEVCHGDTLLDVSSMLMAWDKGPGPYLLNGQTF